MNTGLTKEHSKALQGVAILLMLFNHLFFNPSLLNCTYYSVIDHLFQKDGTEQFLAWVCQICVSFYAFLTGYAYYIGCQKSNPISVSVKHGISFLRKYWLVLVLFIPLGILIGKLEFNPGIIVKHFLLTLTTYNGEWWYAPFYIRLLFLLPFIDYFFKRLEKYFSRYNYGWFFTIAIGSTIVFAVCPLLSLLRAYALVCVQGYLAAKYKVFEWLSAKSLKSRPLNVLHRTLLLSLCIVLRCMFTSNPSSKTVDLFVILPLIYCIAQSLRPQGPAMKCLSFLGRYSPYMWLTHTFYIYYYFQSFSTFSRNSLIMFLQLIIVSLCTAAVLSKIEKLLLICFSKFISIVHF